MPLWKKKKKNLRANQGRFITKDLYKGILKYSRLRNNFLRNRRKTCIEKNTKKITRLLRKPLEKIHKRTFGKIWYKFYQITKKFWQNFKPCFSNKVTVKTTIKLVKNNEMIADKIEIGKLFNEYFVNIVKKLRLFTKEQSAVYTEITFTGKEHPQMKLQLFRKIWIWEFGWLAHQIKSTQIT